MYKRFLIQHLASIAPSVRWLLTALLCSVLTIFWYQFCYIPLQRVATSYRSQNELLGKQKQALEVKASLSQELARRDVQLFTILKKKCKAGSRKLALHLKHITSSLKKHSLKLLSSEQLQKKEFCDWSLTEYTYSFVGSFEEHVAFLSALSSQKSIFCKKALYRKGEGALLATCIFCCVEKG